MKLKIGIISGFLIIALLAALVGYIHIIQLDRIITVIERDFPNEIQKVSKFSELNSNAQLIRHYDEILTQSARNYAFTGDVRWKHKYFEIVPLLDERIKEAIEKGSEKDKTDFENVGNANNNLIQMEEEAISLVDKGDSNEAISILESNKYWNQKNIYESGLISYVNRQGKEYEDILSTSTENLDSLTEDINNLIKSRKKSSILLISFVFVLALVLGIIYSGYFSKPLNRITYSLDQISKGNFDVKLKREWEIDEINLLSDYINRMLASMKLAVLRSGVTKEQMGISRREAGVTKREEEMVGKESKMKGREEEMESKESSLTHREELVTKRENTAKSNKDINRINPKKINNKTTSKNTKIKKSLKNN